MPQAQRLQIGTSRIRPEYIEELRKAWRECRLVPFLGAGVSIPYGIPTWDELVLDLLLESSDGKFNEFWPPYRSALASWLSEQFRFSPLLLARVVKYQSDKKGQRDKFLSLVRDRLYRTHIDAPGGMTLLSELGKFIQESERAGKPIPGVVTFNFDDLLERELTGKGIEPISIYNEATHRSPGFPVYHVHGYLPQGSGPLDSEIVFTEDEFHRLTFSVFHWATVDIANFLRRSTVLFIGMSMSDPNLRRLLDATCVQKTPVRHFLLKKEYQLSRDQMDDAVQEVERRAEEYRVRTRAPQRKTGVQVEAAVRAMLKQAHRYDRRLFKDMGVGVVWVNRFEDIPEILQAIRA